MPSTPMAFAIEHCLIRPPHLSRLAAARLHDDSREAFRRVAEAARTADAPNIKQCIILRLLQIDEDTSYFAWRTTLFELNHTCAKIPIPADHRTLFNALTCFQPCITRSNYLVATKQVGQHTFASIRTRWSPAGLQAAELEWMGRSASASGCSVSDCSASDCSVSDCSSSDCSAPDSSVRDAHILNGAETVATQAFAEYPNTLLERFPRSYVEWLEGTLYEFVVESYRSRAREAVWSRVWEETELEVCWDADREAERQARRERGLAVLMDDEYE